MSFLSKLFGESVSRRSISSQTLEAIRFEWREIDELLKQKGPSQLRQALIKADKTLDNALRDMFPGEGMADRLKEAKDMFDYQTYDNLWKAHKIRNSLVHESGYEPPYHMVISAIESLRTGLKRLGVTL